MKIGLRRRVVTGIDALGTGAVLVVLVTWAPLGAVTGAVTQEAPRPHGYHVEAVEHTG